MRSLRYKIEIRSGVEVMMLFTPHLYSFKGYQGVSFDVSDNERPGEIFEIYADIMFCAALNAWVLDGNGAPEQFPYTRGDFHEYMIADPLGFNVALDFALKALTGKGLQEYIDESGKDESKEPSQPAGESKKKRLRWIGRLLKRS